MLVFAGKALGGFCRFRDLRSEGSTLWGLRVQDLGLGFRV